MKKMMVISAVVAAAAVVFCVKIAKSCIGGKAAPVVLRLSEVQGDGYPTALACGEFSRLVEERSGGRIKIEVYTGGRIYEDESDALGALCDGSLDFARISSAPVSNRVRKLCVIHLPYLFRDKNHFMGVLSGKIGDEMLSSMKESGIGIEGLCFYDSGVRSLYSVSPVHSADDVIGMKIRIQTSPAMMRFCELLGATGITGIPSNEVYNKILNGLVDGAENNISTYKSKGDYQAAPYYTKTEHVYVPDVLIASEKTLKKLGEKDATLIRECAKMTQEFEFRKWLEFEEESERVVRGAKNTIIELSDEERGEFRRKVMPMYRDYESDFGDIIRAIQES